MKIRKLKKKSPASATYINFSMVEIFSLRVLSRSRVNCVWMAYTSHKYKIYVCAVVFLLLKNHHTQQIKMREFQKKKLMLSTSMLNGVPKNVSHSLAYLHFVCGVLLLLFFGVCLFCFYDAILWGIIKCQEIAFAFLSFFS